MPTLSEELRAGIDQNKLADATDKMSLAADEIDHTYAVQARIHVNNYTFREALKAILNMSDLKEIYAKAEEALAFQIDETNEANWQIVYVGP